MILSRNRPLRPGREPVRMPLPHARSMARHGIDPVCAAHPGSRIHRGIRCYHRLLSWFDPHRAALRCLALIDPRAAAPIIAARPHASAVDASPLPIDIQVLGNPLTQPYVLLAAGTRTHDDGVSQWIGALREVGYATVLLQASPRMAPLRYPADLPGLTDHMLRIGRRYGRAAAVIGHALGAASAVAALARGFAAQRAVVISAQADPLDAIQRFGAHIGVGEVATRHAMQMLEARLSTPLESLQGHRLAAAIGVPALVVHDLQDQEVPWSEGERYARHLTAARLLTTFDLGHHDILRSHQVIVQCLRFLAGEPVGDRIVSSHNLPFGMA